MKNNGIVLLTSMLFFLVGCINFSTDSDLEVKKDKINTAREYIENNIFIDMNFDKMGATTRSATESVSDEAKFKAALYRFYKNVETIEGGIDICKLKNGAEINISEDLFLALRSDMESFNEIKRKQIEDGIRAINPPLDDEYFDNLLK